MSVFPMSAYLPRRQRMRYGTRTLNSSPPPSVTVALSATVAHALESIHGSGPVEDNLFANQTMRMHMRLEGLSTNARARDRETMFLLLENSSFGYPGTDGTLFSNYVAYCLNRNPAVSIICAHPLHPFTRPERLVILLCSFCWAFYLSSFMRFAVVRNQYWVVRYTILALLVIPYEILIRVIAVCACVQYDDSEQGMRKRRLWQRSGHFTLLIVMCLNLVWVVFGACYCMFQMCCFMCAIFGQFSH
ncbi:hypothetical protein T492DRAFT_40937 [Pavlovales sp. CCMP2436]|nr:hypothetical protein T492DRAFT_40937 [Pavlovales sp. CCMP2436]